MYDLLTVSSEDQVDSFTYCLQPPVILGPSFILYENYGFIFESFTLKQTGVKLDENISLVLNVTEGGKLVSLFNRKRVYTRA